MGLPEDDGAGAATNRHGIHDRGKALPFPRREWDLKIRHDTVAVSSVLFTIALLMQAPPMIEFSRATHETKFREIATGAEGSAVGDQIAIPNDFAPVGIASLTIIAIGLVVTWTGYIKGFRWTYFVMFVIVWLWAFPVLMLPLVQLYPIWRTVEWIALIKGAISENGVGRATVGPVVAFLLMLIALVLPLKTFLGGRRSQASPDT
jgi:hypothetical protein